MAPQEDRLTRIGIQSSALIEDSHGGRPYITRRPGKLPLTQMPEITSNEVAPYRGTIVKEPVIAIPYRGAMVKEPIIARNEAAQNYGGLEKQPVITSDEAAKYYGGFVIVEHGRKKQFRSAY
uniref:Uncharacterized protein n=1 Tax=Populus trichocarpa TaxID=3694 RepID=A0A3N7H259_POPTR|eukprot:XP_024461701.1 uncharacterized protein LOC112328306 [Populus trichocarpa]